jgi:hypothetical protein
LAIDRKDFDHPVLFLLFVTVGVVSTIAILSAVAQHFGMTGLLGLLKGGVAPDTQSAPHSH